MVFFCALPIGVKQAQQRVRGEMPGAPAVPNLKRKALWTTLAATVLWALAYLLIKLDIYSFRD